MPWGKKSSVPAVFHWVRHSQHKVLSWVFPVRPLTYVSRSEGTVVTQGKSTSYLRPSCAPALGMVVKAAQRELKSA